MLTAAVLLIIFFGLMIIGIPIGYSMLITATVTLKFIHTEIPTIIIPQRIFGGVNNYILLCIPFFMLAGELMGITPLFDRLLKCANAVVGHIKGGLSHVNIVVSMFFAGITGAAAADTSAVGSLLIPAMVEQKYSRGYATAVTVVSSTIGVIIPPSGLMIVAALATANSVAVLFLGGVIPGILAGLAQLVVSLIYGKLKGFPAAEKMTWRQRITVFKDGLPGLGIPIIIMGGILAGIVTPTEAANVSVIYALVVGPPLMRRFPSLIMLYERALIIVSRVSAVMLCVGTAMVLGWIFAIAEVPDAVGAWITSITTNAVMINAGMLVTYVVVGTFLDPIPAILIFTPIFQPLAESVGISSVHFTVTMVFGLAIGLATPPVGSCLFIGSAISGIGVEKFTKELIPFVASMIVILVLIAYVPWLVTYIPEITLGK
jgi:tripartite ATP-independent transporter DctM subunit